MGTAKWNNMSVTSILVVSYKWVWVIESKPSVLRLTPTSFFIGVHQVINQASGRVSHHTVHTQPVGRRFDRVDDFFIPASSLIINHIRYVQYDPRTLLMQIDLQIKITPLAFYSLFFSHTQYYNNDLDECFVWVCACLLMEVFGGKSGCHLCCREGGKPPEIVLKINPCYISCGINFLNLNLWNQTLLSWIAKRSVL